MKPNPSTKSGGGEKAAGFIKVTQKMVQARAGKLAELKGRYACDVTEADLAQARHELTNESAANP